MNAVQMLHSAGLDIASMSLSLEFWIEHDNIVSGNYSQNRYINSYSDRLLSLVN